VVPVPASRSSTLGEQRRPVANELMTARACRLARSVPWHRQRATAPAPRYAATMAPPSTSLSLYHRRLTHARHDPVAHRKRLSVGPPPKRKLREHGAVFLNLAVEPARFPGNTDQGPRRARRRSSRRRRVRPRAPLYRCAAREPAHHAKAQPRQLRPDLFRPSPDHKAACGASRRWRCWVG